MSNRIKDAFASIHAEEALKTHTKAVLVEVIQKRSRPRRSRRLVPVFACILFVILGFGGHQIYFTPTAAICIDINPSLELSINRFDRVISTSAYNEAGEALLALQDVRFLTCDEAVTRILENADSYLSQGEAFSIGVVGEDQQQCDRLLSEVESCTSEHENAHCYSVGAAEKDAAEELGLSHGKYRAFLALQELDPSITPEAVENMSMQEIRDLIESLSGIEKEENFHTQNSSNGQNSAHGQNGHHGNGSNHE